MIRASQAEEDLCEIRRELIEICRLLGEQFLVREASNAELLYTIRRAVNEQQAPSPYVVHGEEFTYGEWLGYEE